MHGNYKTRMKLPPQMILSEVSPSHTTTTYKKPPLFPHHNLSFLLMYYNAKVVILIAFFQNLNGYTKVYKLLVFKKYLPRMDIGYAFFFFIVFLSKYYPHYIFYQKMVTYVKTRSFFYPKNLLWAHSKTLNWYKTYVSVIRT